MAYTAWDALTLCTPDDVRAKGSLIGLSQGADTIRANEVVTEAIATGKDRLRRMLLNTLQRVFPTTTDQLIRMADANIRQALSLLYDQMRARGVDAMATIQWNAGIGFTPLYYADWLQYWNLPRPRVFWNSGAPAATTLFAGTADAGDFLGDSQNRFVYVSYAANPAVNWQLFTPGDLINYITNPKELRDANIYAAVVAALERITLLADTGSAIAERALQQLSYWRPEAEAVIKACTQIVTVDVGNAGSVPPYNAVKLNRSRWLA